MSLTSTYQIVTQTSLMHQRSQKDFNKIISNGVWVFKCVGNNQQV